ncbi:MAG TPA: TetR/AcrR family transcriptional regulator [Bacillus bacterium]|uniref:TetR family transcriptional regulator n=1 Tax=Siminovitchia fordii TaxID=254759 RepID=UPI00037246FF|nr:TetR family transcriptional regulator [Siminovitchia fordii]HBZ10206.1 TetR/AcrR family transcriptional regulator [Bacillus sp. (in: firmicutes)]
MSVQEKIYKVAEKLLESKPFDQITFAEIAELAGVHWTAVRRHFGGREGMRNWLQEKQSNMKEGFKDTRTRIIEAGTRIFSVQGYGNASLDKVASDAGLTKGAVYWHFSSKQDLFLAILEHHLTQQLQILPSQIEKMLSTSNPKTALTDWLKTQFNFFEINDGSSRLFLEFVAANREPEVQKKLQSIHGKIIDGVGTYLHEMQKKGLVSSELHPNSLSVTIDAFMKGILIEYIIDPTHFKINPIFETISNVLWDGIAPKKRSVI